MTSKCAINRCRLVHALSCTAPLILTLKEMCTLQHKPSYKRCRWKIGLRYIIIDRFIVCVCVFVRNYKQLLNCETTCNVWQWSVNKVPWKSTMLSWFCFCINKTFPPFILRSWPIFWMTRTRFTFVLGLLQNTSYICLQTALKYILTR